MTEQELVARIFDALEPVVKSFPEPSPALSHETNALIHRCYRLLTAAAKQQHRLAKKEKVLLHRT